MKKLLPFIIFLFGFSTLWGQSVELRGREILEKADLRLYPAEGTYDIKVGEIKTSGKPKEYEMQVYKSGKESQTIVWAGPRVMKNNVSIRSGETIYYKPLKAAKPNIMSYQAVFMNSSFSWGDVISADLVADYKTISIKDANEAGVDCFLLELVPLKGNRYAKIDIWIDKSNFDTKKRLFYTASGDEMKQAVFSDYKVENGKVVYFKVIVEDFFLESKSYAEFSNLKDETLPKFFFDVKNISRIHVR